MCEHGTSSGTNAKTNMQMVIKLKIHIVIRDDGLNDGVGFNGKMIYTSFGALEYHFSCFGCHATNVRPKEIPRLEWNFIRARWLKAPDVTNDVDFSSNYFRFISFNYRLIFCANCVRWLNTVGQMRMCNQRECTCTLNAHAHRLILSEIARSASNNDRWVPFYRTW